LLSDQFYLKKNPEITSQPFEKSAVAAINAYCQEEEQACETKSSESRVEERVSAV
jgi:hypothetical protein